MGIFGWGKKIAAMERMKWIKLQSIEELDHIVAKESFVTPIVLFKHSTRCSISSMALSRMESNWDVPAEKALPVYLDLIQYRDISNKIAGDLNVKHESPQIIVVKNGACVYEASHNEIIVDEIKKHL